METVMTLVPHLYNEGNPKCQVPQVTRVPHSFAYFAKEWALRAAFVIKAFRRTRFDLQSPLLKVDPDQTSLTMKIRAEAAPFPLELAS